MGQLAHRPGARRKVVGPDENDGTVAGLGQHDREVTLMGGPHVGGLVVAVKRVERDGEAGPARSPLRALAYETVGDVAERAMRASEARADEVRELATDGSVGVVHADEPADRPRAVCFVGLHVYVGYGCWLLTETISPVMYDE